MQSEFNEIYEDLSNSYAPLSIRGKRSITSGPQWISEHIDKTTAELHVKLRPDAKHFLLTSFWEMIVLPVSHPKNLTPIPQNELRDAILNDVRTVLKTASQQRDGQKVTGGDVLKVVAQHWGRLKINGLRFWGAE